MMPSKAVIYGIAILSLLIIVGGCVNWMFANSMPSSVQPSTTPNSNGSQNPDNSGDVSPSDGSSEGNELPAASPTEQIRDGVMAYLQTNHPEVTPFLPNSSWVGGLQSIDTDNTQFYVYNSSGWGVTIQFNDSPNPQYFVTANYKAGTVYWEGTYENDVFAEISYSAKGLPSLLSTQEQVRDAVMNFIKTKHPQTAQLMTSFEWSGQKEETELLGEENYVYNSGSWTVKIRYPVTSDPTYTVIADYTGNSLVSWQGTYLHGAIKETSYRANISAP